MGNSQKLELVKQVPDLSHTLTQTTGLDPIVNMVSIVSAVGRGAITGYRIGMYLTPNYVI